MVIKSKQMGFIERLKQKQLAKLQGEQQLRNQQLAEVEAKRRSDAAEREFHE